MKQLFVIGPSGVGKTTLCKKLSDIERNVVHVSFDEQVNLLADIHFPLPQRRSGNDGREFWRFCKGVMANLTNQLHTDITLLIDVDAGAEYIPECQEYLIERCESVICLMGDPDEIHTRVMMRAAELGNPTEEKEQYLAREFSPDLQRLYESAAIKINVTHENIEAAIEAFRTAVNQLAAK